MPQPFWTLLVSSIMKLWMLTVNQHKKIWFLIMFTIWYSSQATFRAPLYPYSPCTSSRTSHIHETQSTVVFVGHELTVCHIHEPQLMVVLDISSHSQMHSRTLVDRTLISHSSCPHLQRSKVMREEGSCVETKRFLLERK